LMSPLSDDFGRPSSVVPAPRARHALRMFQPFPAALLVAATTTRRRCLPCFECGL
jgi:hypothetical protein